MPKCNTAGLRKAAVLRADDLNTSRAVRNLARAIKILESHVNAQAERLAALAPESAPPVPVTAPPTEPTAASMTAAEFYAELDKILAGVKRNGANVAVTLAVDLGARWRAATGLWLPVRPR